MKNWQKKLVDSSTVLGSTLVITAFLWNFGVKATLANDFTTRERFSEGVSRINERIEDLKEEDDSLVKKIDGISDKIDTIYKILITKG